MKMRRRWLIVSTSCVSSAMQRLLKTMPSNTDLQAALNATTIAIVIEGRQHWPHDLKDCRRSFIMDRCDFDLEFAFG
jgi:hypothetical protein